MVHACPENFEFQKSVKAISYDFTVKLVQREQQKIALLEENFFMLKFVFS